MELPVKSIVKSMIPQRYRLLRYTIYEKCRYLPQIILNLGDRVECPFCRWRFRSFLAAGFDYPVLTRMQVVGARRCPNVVCPRCCSHARERLMYLYLVNKTALFSQGGKLLHFAPEPNLQKALRKCPSIDYVSVDLEAGRVMVKSDITRLPFPNNLFDVILCSHVLEHVPEDRVAMAELYRVLKPGGWAMLQVPIALALAETYEDPAMITEEERIQAFGQRDHVRLYGGDYPNRLRETGFSVQARSCAQEFDGTTVERYGLTPEEDIFICQKTIGPAHPALTIPSRVRPVNLDGGFGIR